MAGWAPELVSRRFDELVLQEEQRAASNPLDQNVAPFASTVRDFAVRRLRALAKAAELALHTRTARGGRAQPGLGFEVWVQNPAGTAGGRIDWVSIENQMLVIGDYKTGQITQEDAEGNLVLKPDYVQQMNLYAALYSVQFGRWPDRAVVMPVGGSGKDIPIDRAAALAALDRLLLAQAIVNDQLARQSDVVWSGLAKPSPQTCRYCAYRPTCGGYAASKGAANPEGDWPNDVFGTVTEIASLQFGTMITLAEDSGARVVRVRNLAQPKPQDGIVKGKAVRIFGLKRTSSPDSFDAVPSTVLYVKGA